MLRRSRSFIIYYFNFCFDEDREGKKEEKKSAAHALYAEGDRSLSEQFNTWKDVVIPGLEPDAQFTSGSLRESNPGSPRDIFAYFRGTIRNKGGHSYSRGIRIDMEQRLRGVPDVVFTEETPACSRDCYRKEMRRSQFCLCPRGWSPWTLRAYQAMMAGCVPVILADEIELPYENVLDWSKLSVKIPERDAGRVLEILRAIPGKVVEAKRAAIDKVWRSVAWLDPPHPEDAFHAVLGEIGRKKRLMRASSLTTWYD